MFPKATGHITAQGPIRLPVASAQRTTARPTARPAQQSTLGKVGGGITRGATKVGGGMASGAAWVGGGAQKILEHPMTKPMARGCVSGVLGGLALAGGIAAVTGGQFEISGLMLASDCAVGASAGGLNYVKEGLGGGLEALDNAFDGYQIYNRYLR